MSEKRYFLVIKTFRKEEWRPGDFTERLLSTEEKEIPAGAVPLTREEVLKVATAVVAYPNSDEKEGVTYDFFWADQELEKIFGKEQVKEPIE